MDVIQTTRGRETTVVQTNYTTGAGNKIAIQVGIDTSFPNRSALVTFLSEMGTRGEIPLVGTIVSSEGYSYRYIGTGTAIPDMQGWVPHGDATARHWGADPTGTLDCYAQIMDLIDYVQAQGGGIARIPAGRYNLSEGIVRPRMHNVTITGDGRAIPLRGEDGESISSPPVFSDDATILVRTATDNQPVIRCWGGVNNVIKNLAVDCQGYDGRGIYIQDQYSGIVDCAVINCPERALGTNGGNNLIYGLDNTGNIQDEGETRTMTFWPIGCYIEGCYVERGGATAIANRSMRYARVQNCTVKNIYSEGITLDHCDYSLVTGCNLIDVALTDPEQFPDPNGSGSYLAGAAGGVGGIGIDGSYGSRVIGNIIKGVNTTEPDINARTRAAIHFINNITKSRACVVTGNHIEDAKCGIWVDDGLGETGAPSGNNYAHVITGNTFKTIGQSAGTGDLPKYGDIWLDFHTHICFVGGNTNDDGTPRLVNQNDNLILASQNGVETFSNKSLTDTQNYFVNTTDETKRVRLDVSGVTTATTRVYDAPDYPGTLAVFAAPVNFVNLPAPGNVGRRGMIYNASSTTFGSVAAGGGSNIVPVYDDGTDWRIG